ncbi:ribosome recycling factor [bacterium]|nr:ribosome recycling factor [bacterium]
MNDTEKKMMATIENLKNRLTTIRAGRANPALLNGIMVNYYGSPTPIQSIANVTVPEARQLFIKPFDRSSLKDIERAINEANLGIAPTNNGEMIILSIPELTEDKRKEYVKQAKNIGEEAKVALRNIRQEANTEIKKEEYPEDEEKLLLSDIQELINKYNKLVDEEIKIKEEELMHF